MDDESGEFMERAELTRVGRSESKMTARTRHSIVIPGVTTMTAGYDSSLRADLAPSPLGRGA